jgi:hypothetical protein
MQAVVNDRNVAIVSFIDDFRAEYLKDTLLRS